MTSVTSFCTYKQQLCSQLFGEDDPDQDVSPDTADPEAAGDTAGEEALQKDANEKGNVERVSTRTWAQSTNYDPEKIFTKLFHDDIKYLLSMDNLWKKRRPPVPLEWNNLSEGGIKMNSSTKDNLSFLFIIIVKIPENNGKDNEGGLRDQQQWSLSKCGAIFAESIKNLSTTYAACKAKSENDHLVWDKDDPAAMDFVASCANIRAQIFGIAPKTRFDIKCKLFS